MYNITQRYTLTHQIREKIIDVVDDCDMVVAARWVGFSVSEISDFQTLYFLIQNDAENILWVSFWWEIRLEIKADMKGTVTLIKCMSSSLHM